MIKILQVPWIISRRRYTTPMSCQTTTITILTNKLDYKKTKKIQENIEKLLEHVIGTFGVLLMSFHESTIFSKEHEQKCCYSPGWIIITSLVYQSPYHYLSLVYRICLVLCTTTCFLPISCASSWLHGKLFLFSFPIHKIKYLSRL